MNTRILAAVTIAAILAVAMGASSSSKPHFSTRFDNAVSDLMQAQASIPHQALHARAQQVLRERMVAEGEQ